MEEDRRLELEVRGRVQGVAFRWSAREKAERLGLTGWVRNQADGSVRLMAEGPASALRSLRVWCETGPPRARVDRLVVVEEGPARGDFVGFGVRT